MRALRLAAAAVFLVVVGSAVIAPPASAHGGDPATEGYVIVQQALSYLVNDTGPEGTAQALMKVDDALAAPDQEGVAVAEVGQAKTALQAGRVAEARTLLQGSITEAVTALKPATGEETGTTVVAAPLPPRAMFTGGDWALLVVSLLVVLAGAGLAVLFRPRQSMSGLRAMLGPQGTPGAGGTERERPRGHDHGQ